MNDSLIDHGTVMEDASPHARGRVPADRGSDRGSETPLTPQGGNWAGTCPRCRARAGNPCVDRGGRERQRPHAGRGSVADHDSFKAEGLAFVAEYCPDDPEWMAFAAWTVERYLAGGVPDPVKVRARVAARMLRTGL